jgi:uncharacterized membrane protein YkvA (DUF1232 family)
MFNGLLNQFRITLRLFRDPRVPMWKKAVPVLALLYIVSPFDFVPDLIPGLGQLDDIGILLAAMRLFEMISPEAVVIQQRKAVEREHS